MNITNPSGLVVLIVDDNATNLMLMSTLAQTAAGAATVCFESPLKALLWCEENTPDLVLVDYMMPDIDGIEFIRRFVTMPDFSEVPIVMVTTENEKQIRREALGLGATEFLAKPLDALEFRIRVRNLLALRRAQNLLKDRARLLEVEVERATEVIVQNERDLIFRLSRAAEYRDPETGSHILRMAHYSELIARELGLAVDFQRRILIASPMHDIGKIGIPDHVLLKPGKLDEAEWDLMRRHPAIGKEILDGSRSPLIRLAAEIAGAHHERWDGAGYPNGLAGSTIPLAGRIVAVADVFDALTSARPYKKAWPMAQARQFIADNAGSHFCPECAHAFLVAWDEAVVIRNRFPDHAESEQRVLLQKEPA